MQGLGPDLQEENVHQDSDPSSQAPTRATQYSPTWLLLPARHPTSSFNLREGKWDFQAAKRG